MITDNELAQIMPNLPADRRALYLPHLQAAMNEFQINTYLREAAFIAQLAHESMELKAWSENLNYSAQALLRVFPKYFKTSAQANQYARQPEKIANRVYASRMGNGDEASGDGWRYRGRGPIQLTGKDNYRTFGTSLGLDLVGNPDTAATPEVGFRTAGAFWVSRGCNAMADRQDFVGITRAINGGTNGLEDRQKFYTRAKQVLSRDDQPAPATRAMPAARDLSIPSDLSRGILPGAPETIEMFGGTHDPVRGGEEEGGADTGGGAQKGGAKKGGAGKGAAKKASAASRSTGKASQSEGRASKQESNLSALGRGGAKKGSGKGGAKKSAAKKSATKKSAAKSGAKKGGGKKGRMHNIMSGILDNLPKRGAASKRGASKKGGAKKSSGGSGAKKGAAKQSAGKSASKKSAAGKSGGQKAAAKKGGSRKGTSKKGAAQRGWSRGGG